MQPSTGPRPLRDGFARRPRRSAPASVRSPLPALALAALLAGCGAVPEAKVWNLEQVHQPDGRPKYHGVVQRDTQYRLRKIGTFLARSGGPDLGTTEDKPIENPMEVCLENLIELQKVSTDSARVRGLKAQTFAWLGADCTYALSRERCMRGLGRLGAYYDLKGPITLDPQVEAIDADELRQLLKELVPPARELLAGARDEDGLTAERIAAGCRAVAVERRDRDGARRLLAILDVLLGQGDFDTDALAPLAELHSEVARRCVGLALASGMRDDSPVVRASALEACVVMTRNRVPRLVRGGISDPDAVVVTRALKLVGRYGLPPLESEPDFDGTPEEYEAAWLDLFAQVLRAVFDGEIAVAACQAMARVSGEPQNLRPEAWVEWWSAERERVVRP